MLVPSESSRQVAALKLPIVLTLCTAVGLTLCAALLGVEQRFETAIFTATVTLAAFSANFSLVAFQFSPYRALFRALPRSNVAAAAGLVALAVSPLLAIGGPLPRCSAPPILMAAMILVASGGLGLLLLTNRANQPAAIIDACLAKRILDRFFAEATASLLKQFKVAQASPVTAGSLQPTHEWDFPAPRIALPSDPFATLATLARLAVAADDRVAFAESTRALLRLGVQAVRRELEPKEGLRIRDTLIRHAYGNLESVGIDALAKDHTGTYVSLFVDLCAEAAAGAAGDVGEIPSESRIVVVAMSAVARKALDSGHAHPALTTIVAARQLVQSAIDDLPSDADVMTLANVGVLIPIMARIGQWSITRRNVDLLYRCLDALGWTGAAAVASSRYPLAESVARGLVQLGREARGAKLDCFWPRCALSPYDHAWERLEWMLNKPDDATCAELVGRALSALDGHECTVSWEQGRPIITTTTEPVRVSFSKGTRRATVDFSDPQMTREFWYY